MAERARERQRQREREDTQTRASREVDSPCFGGWIQVDSGGFEWIWIAINLEDVAAVQRLSMHGGGFSATASTLYNIKRSQVMPQGAVAKACRPAQVFLEF